MQTLRGTIAAAADAKRAIGHFNISTTDALWAIFDAARAAHLPVIIGVSEGERKFIGARQAVALVKSLRDEFKHPIFINADHTYSFEGVKEAIDLGFDAAIFDGAQLPFDENIAITKKCVEYARSVNPDIVVEGELGYIGKSSEIIDAVPEGVLEAGKTTPEDARAFVTRTGVDLFAPSVGNIHGIVKSGNPALDSKLIKEIRDATGIPLVLHGGSGSTDEEFVSAAHAGAAIIHINTEIRKAWRDGLATALKENPNEVAPYKLLKGAKEKVQKIIEQRIKLFNS